MILIVTKSLFFLSVRIDHCVTEQVQELETKLETKNTLVESTSISNNQLNTQVTSLKLERQQQLEAMQQQEQALIDAEGALRGRMAELEAAVDAKSATDDWQLHQQVSDLRFLAALGGVAYSCFSVAAAAHLLWPSLDSIVDC